MSEFFDENSGVDEKPKAQPDADSQHPEPPAQPEQPPAQPEQFSAQPEQPPAQPEQPSAQPEQPSAQPEQFSAQPERPFTQPGQAPPPYVPPMYDPPQSRQTVYRYSAYSADNPTYNRPQPEQPQQQYPPMQPSKKRRSRKGLKRAISAVMAVLLVLGGVGIGKFCFTESGIGANPPSDSTGSVNEGAPSLVISDTPNATNTAAGGALATSAIAEKVAPSIVAVLVYANSSGELATEGSGIIMGVDDSKTYTYIVTCAHVISGSGLSISIQLEDGTQYEAIVVGYDAKTDIGVLKVKADGLTAATFGDSDALKVGDSVYAMGNPGGTEFFGSFTGGMVSAIDRSVTSTYTMECIQHDAAINPGNSGGALINQCGQVVGVNSLKIVDTQYEGMGFAVPINTAQEVVNSLISHGYVPNRPKLGIKYAPVSQYQQYSLLVQIHNIPSGSLIIREIDSDSALSGTDVQLYDLIIAAGGEKMTSADVLLDKIESGKVGDKVELTIARITANYQLSTFDIEVTLVEDKGSRLSDEEETTTSPFEYYEHFFQNPFGY